MILEDQLILVDNTDSPIGTMGKMETHEKGLLHRAFSIIAVNDKGEIMLQQRAMTKYHSGGLWTNTCCGHPRDGEDLMAAAHRRLGEEMGFDCQLSEIFTCTYQAQLNKGLQEHEFLHVCTGIYTNAPHINPEEADDWKWMSPKAIIADIAVHPDHYTFWFKEVMRQIQTRDIVLH